MKFLTIILAFLLSLFIIQCVYGQGGYMRNDGINSLIYKQMKKNERAEINRQRKIAKREYEDAKYLKAVRRQSLMYGRQRTYNRYYIQRFYLAIPRQYNTYPYQY